ncbi:anti-sigma factor family protein [Mycolicibacterium vinylchloridicum]|uniref:anti-sigma factor family protein n=1 Tax=Mycolicibacterium vinylchloridicum TaxID=2736928 RepID=UPI0015CABA59|nr:zf-HC2 domain-containing protein [Mycolicibacterium vinylchloridicum]
MTTFDGSPSPGGTHEYALWDAAYVLGSLSCSQRREFEAHLRSCPECAEAVGELSGVPALLSQIDRAYVDTIDEYGTHAYAALPPLRDQMLATVNSHRRRSRAMTWTLAAAVVATGVFVGTESNPMVPAPVNEHAPALAMTPVKPVSLSATVTLSRRPWGTRIDMNCTYAAGPVDVEYDAGRADGKLAMVAVGRDGSHVQLATWTAHTGTPASPGGSTSMPIDQIASVQVVTADAGAVLLQRDL